MEDLYYSIENKSFLGEHKVITPKLQFLGIILCFFYVFQMAMAITFFCENALEAIYSFFLPHLMIFEF